VFTNLRSKLKDFLASITKMPMTLEELRQNFPHGENCSRKLALRLSEEDGYEWTSDNPWFGAWYTKVTRSYIECPECRVKEQYY
jgi:hypothetical protein